MTDVKISALPAVTTPAGSDEFAVNQGGTSKKLTLAQVNAYCEPLCNTSVSDQALTAGTDTYVTGSSIVVPTTRLQARSIYRCRVHVTKTAAGTATPTASIRYGTNGTTADTTRSTLTFSAQTAAVDQAVFEFLVTFRTVGSGTSAAIKFVGGITHALASTGFANGTGAVQNATSAGFDSTPAGSIIGLSMNSGSSAAWTVSLVQSELVNLL